MEIIYKETQSNKKPLEIDVESSPNGVYLRRNIKEVEHTTQNTDGEDLTFTMYEYQEAFLSKSEYEQISKELLVSEINGEENSQEFEEYKTKLRTPVQYKNGKFYKPSWIPLYSGIMDEFNSKIQLYEKADGDVSPFLDITTNIYDATGKEENVEQMTIKEIVELWLFLYKLKEQYYKEYKESMQAIKNEVE